jgi:hypothetical protein
MRILAERATQQILDRDVAMQSQGSWNHACILGDSRRHGSRK